MWLARLIGRIAADVVAIFRDKPFIPCQVDWGTPLSPAEQADFDALVELLRPFTDDDDGDIAIDLDEEYP